MGLLERRLDSPHPFTQKVVQFAALSLPPMLNSSWANGGPVTPELQVWLDAAEELYQEGKKQMEAGKQGADPASLCGKDPLPQSHIRTVILTRDSQVTAGQG